MSNEHIGRLLQIGVGSETVAAGTAANPSRWLKKVSGQLLPVTQKVENESSIGNIGSRIGVEVVKRSTKLPFQGLAHYNDIGYLLKAAFGQDTLCIPCTFSNVAGGTPAVGDLVSIVAPAMTGEIIYIAEGVYHIKKNSGNFTAASNGQSMTNGVWTADVGSIDNVIFSHVFERLNTNNPPSYTLYAYDPVDPQRATYGVLDRIEFEFASDKIVEVSGEFMAQKIEDDATGTTPSYDADEKPFIGRQSQVKIAPTLASVGSAEASPLSRLKLSISKNAEGFQAIGSDEDRSIHNKNWDMIGDFDALFNSLTFRDYDINNTARAMRILVDGDTTIGTTGNPQLIFDITEVNFVDFGGNDDNNGLRKQSLGFKQNEVVDDATGMAIVAVLTNTISSAY